MFSISSGAQGSWRGNAYTGGRVGTWLVTGSYGGVSTAVPIDITYAKMWLSLVWRSAGGRDTALE
jgi:hypothetical protein